MKRHRRNADKTEQRKKLQLRRETVRVLSAEDLSEVAGGYNRRSGSGYSSQCMSLDTGGC